MSRREQRRPEMSEERPPALTAAVIAGGQSTRFGKQKQNAVFQGKTLMTIATETALQLTSSVLVIDNGIGDQPMDGVRYLHDRKAGQGPLGGLATAMAVTETAWLALIPCDMPLLTSELYRTLWHHRQGHRPVVATGENGMEPLVSIWPTAVRPHIDQALESGQRSLRTLLIALRSHTLDVATVIPDLDPRWHWNINRQEDLDRMEETSRR